MSTKFPLIRENRFYPGSGKARNAKGKEREAVQAAVQVALVAPKVARSAQNIHTHNKDKVMGKSLSNTPKPCKPFNSHRCFSAVDLLPISLYFAQQRANAVVIPPGNGTGEISWGAVYTYDGNVFVAAESAPIVTDPNGGLILDYSNYTIQASDVVGISSGRCTRIDPNDQSSALFYGKMYCELSYGFEDNGEFTYLTAEGVARQESGRHPFAIALAVTGGTGIFRRVIGELSLAPASAPDMSYYVEVIGNLYMDSRVVDAETYRQIIA